MVLFLLSFCIKKIFSLKGGDANTWLTKLAIILWKEVIIIHNLLLERLDKENNRLNEYGDILVILAKHDSKLDLFERSDLAILCFKFEELTDSLNNLYVAIIKCNHNNNLLKECIPFLNELSYLIAVYIMGIMKMKEVMKWK